MKTKQQPSERQQSCERLIKHMRKHMPAVKFGRGGVVTMHKRKLLDYLGYAYINGYYRCSNAVKDAMHGGAK